MNNNAAGTNNVEEFYDADEQKYLTQQKLGRTELIWLQIKRCTDCSSFDPNGKGVYMQQLIGKGDKSITQEVYLGHPHNDYYFSIQQLEGLLSPEIVQNKIFRDKLDKIKEAMHKKNKALYEDAKLKKKEDRFVYDFKMSKAFFQMLIVLVDEYYGREIPLIDTIEPRAYVGEDMVKVLKVEKAEKVEKGVTDEQERRFVDNQEAIKEE